MRKALIALLAALLALSPALASAEQPSSGPVALIDNRGKQAPEDNADAPALNYYQAEAAYKEKDYETALALLLPLSEAGDADSQVLLARMYISGDGVEHDYGAALALLTPLADAGNPEALYRLAGMYARGEGVEESDEKHIEYLEAAANAGSTDAMVSLGNIYSKGRYGVAKREKKAFGYYKKAAELGDDNGMFYLGLCYCYGIGTEKDFEKALEWYERAAESGNLSAYSALGDKFMDSDFGCPDYERAMAYYQAGSQAGYDYCSWLIGEMYRNGRGVAQDYEEAARWYRLAMEQGYPESLIYDQLTEMGIPNEGTGFAQAKAAYLNGDIDRAIELLVPLANDGDADAQALWGEMLFAQYLDSGLNDAEGLELARQMYQLAADQGNAAGLFGLGSILYFYSDDADSKASGLEYLKSAADKGDLDARALMGHLYFYGIDVEQSYRTAFAMLAQPSESGIKSAAYLVGLMYFTDLGPNYHLSRDFFWSRALDYFLSASEGGIGEADYMIGLMCEHGLGVARDATKADYYYSRAADAGIHTLEEAMGLRMYYDYYTQVYPLQDLGFPLDPPSTGGKDSSVASTDSETEATIAEIADFHSSYIADLMQRASEGDPEAQFELGTTYKTGLNPEGQSYEKAAHYFKLAADQDYGPGCYFLAVCYEMGEGVPEDADMAKYYYDLAAQLGVSNSDDAWAFLF